VALSLRLAQHRFVVTDVHPLGDHPIRVAWRWLGGLPPDQPGGQGFQQGPPLIGARRSGWFEHRGGPWTVGSNLPRSEGVPIDPGQSKQGVNVAEFHRQFPDSFVEQARLQSTGIELDIPVAATMP
jgi:hypothetical protein